MWLLPILLACLASMEVRGQQVVPPYKCHELPNNDSRCITAGGVEYDTRMKLAYMSVLQPNSTEPWPPGFPNGTNLNSRANVTRRSPVHARSASNLSLANSPELTTQELQAQINSSDSFSTSNKTEMEPLSVNRAISSEEPTVPEVQAETTVSSGAANGLGSNATSVPLEPLISSGLLVEGHCAPAGGQSESDNVESRSSSSYSCCCAELQSTRNTRNLLKERGLTLDLQYARPHGLPFIYCRAGSCGRNDGSSVGRCVQKYRNTSVAIGQENKLRSHWVLQVEDGCECLPHPADQPRPTRRVCDTELETSSIHQSPGPSPQDSTFNNIANIINDGLVKLAFVSKKLFSLIVISGKTNDTRALANSLDETAGLIEQAADQLLDLNSAGVNKSRSPTRLQPLVTTITVTIDTCLQTGSHVKPVVGISDKDSTNSFISPSPGQGFLPDSQSSTESNAAPLYSNEGTSGTVTPLLVPSLYVGSSGIPTADSSTSTNETRNQSVLLPPLSTKEKYFSSSPHFSDGWLPGSAPETSGSLPPHTVIPGLKAPTTGEWTVTRAVIFAVINGVTFTVGPNYPSTSVEGNGGYFPTSGPKFPPQSVIDVHNSATSSKTSVVPFLSTSTALEPATTIPGSTAAIGLPGAVSVSTSYPEAASLVPDTGAAPVVSGSLWSATVGPPDVSPSRPTPGLRPEGSVHTGPISSNEIITDSPANQSLTNRTIDVLENTSSQEDKLLEMAESIHELKKKMECLVNKTGETKTIFEPQNRDFLSQPLEHQALLMPIWREFAASKVLNDLGNGILARCSSVLNTTAPLSGVPREISTRIKSLEKVSGLLMAVMELSHCANLQLSCDFLIGLQLQRRLAAAQLIGTILTQPRQSEVNIFTLIDLFPVDSRNSTSLYSEERQTSLISRISLYKELDRALQWSKSESESEGIDDLSAYYLGIVLGYGVKLKHILREYVQLCTAESAVPANISNADVQSTAQSTQAGTPSQVKTSSSTVDSIASQIASIKFPQQTPTFRPQPEQQPATSALFAQIFPGVPQYGPISLSKDKLEKLVFPSKFRKV